MKEVCVCVWLEIMQNLYITFTLSFESQLVKFNSPLAGVCQEEMGLGLCMVKRLMVGQRGRLLACR